MTTYWLDMGLREGGYRDGPRDGFYPHHDNYGPHHGGPPDDRSGKGERHRRDEGPPGVSLLVRNLPSDIQAQDLQMAFGRIGVLRDVYIPRDFHSQQPKGFAFIEYATPEMAREARNEMDRFVIKGSQLEVVFAQERRKTPNEMRGRVADAHSRRSPERGERASGERSGGGFERYVIKQKKEREFGFYTHLLDYDLVLHRLKGRSRRNETPGTPIILSRMMGPLQSRGDNRSHLECDVGCCG